MFPNRNWNWNSNNADVINAEVKIGDNCIINAAVIDHGSNETILTYRLAL